MVASWLDLSLFTAIGTGLMLLAAAKHPKKGQQDPTGHPVRRGILDMIRRRPGTRLNAIWRAFSTNRGTAHYHLIMLERAGTVKSVRDGQATRYFPGHVGTAQLPLLALLMRGRVLEVARAILEEPGISQRRLTRLLPISRKVFRDYADRLAAMELLTEVRDARVKRYFPTEKLASLLQELEQATPGGDDPPRPS